MESRCGLLCSECSYKEQVGCKGCVNIEKPFWGESCPVKSCSETKGYKHCGQCKDFPCALVKQFAYDEKRGFEQSKLLFSFSKLDLRGCLRHFGFSG
ncbi:MAG: DUF3795 domain-containing protein [Enterocloster asparagiformis]|nr:DUF3795 domain-containing protein [Enterocloster asparagiformis]